MSRTIAIIPARKGSKRLPGKNKKELCGKPLIAWTIDESVKVKELNEIRITTDDLDIIDYCKSYKSIKRVRIILRPDELAQDDTPMLETVLQATSDLAPLDVAVLLQPTTPLREAKDIRSSLGLYNPLIPFRVITGYRDDFYTFKLNGACYVIPVRALRSSKAIVGDEPFIMNVMPKERSIDIDHLEDFKKCEELLKKREIKDV